jgi:hypothetical protein
MDTETRFDRISVPRRSRLRHAAERVVRLSEDWHKPNQADVWKAKVGCATSRPTSSHDHERATTLAAKAAA